MIIGRNSREVNCIVHDGSRYCEKPEILPGGEFVGVVLLILVAVWMIYIANKNI